MSLLLRACFFLLAVLPLTAHADTIDDFRLVGQGHIITYSLLATAVIMDHPHGVTLGASAPTTIDSTSGYSESGLYYLPFPSLPDVTLTVPSSINGGSLVFFGPAVLQVSEVIPVSDPTPFNPDDLLVTFVPGTYVLTLDDPGLSPLVTYTLAIAAETTPTPEPSTLTLLATGTVSLLRLATLRRKTMQART